MIERRIVRRYAQALFNAASKADVVDRVESDLGFVGYAFESSDDLMDAFRSPLIPRDRKKAIVRALFEEKIHEITLSYLDLLVENRREEAVVQTEAEYIEIANEARGIVNVLVTSAVRLEDDEEARLVAKLNAITGKSVHLEKHVDPSIIGGVVIRIGDKLIDGSIRGQLDRLREQLIS